MSTCKKRTPDANQFDKSIVDIAPGERRRLYSLG